MQIFTGDVPQTNNGPLNGMNIYHETHLYDRIDFDLYLIKLETSDRKL